MESEGRVLVQALGAGRLHRLLLALAAVLAVYCLYYGVAGRWLVATGGGITAASLLALAFAVGRARRLPGRGPVALALIGINAGTVMAVSPMGVSGVAWLAPLVLANLLLGGPSLGALFSALTIGAIILAGGLYRDVDAAVNVLGALLLSILIAVAFGRSLRAHFARLEAEAQHDPLTGAVNRAGLTRALDLRLPRVEAGQPLSLILFDLDHFKGLNDRLGHTAGDGLLQAFVRLLADNLRRADSVYRYGGEEFAVLVDGDVDAGLRVADKLRQRVAQHTFAQAGAVTVSAGIAEARPGDTERALISRADKALYEAKHAGRNRCVRASGAGA